MEHPAEPPGTSRPVRWVYVGVGSVAVALGVLGIVLPLLPTTPFLLVAAGAYARGSRRLHAWLLHHPRLGPVLEHWWTDRRVPRSAKYGGIVLVWTSILLTVLFWAPFLWVKALLAAVALGVTIFLARLRTWTPSTPAPLPVARP